MSETAAQKKAREAHEKKKMAEMSISLGIMIEIDGKQITLQPSKEMAKLAKDKAGKDATSGPGTIANRGIEAELPPGMRVDLGQVGERINDIVGVFQPGFDIEKLCIDTGVEQIDKKIQDIVNWLAQAHFGIEALHLKIPAKEGDKRPPIQYMIGFSLTWPGDAGKIHDDIDLALKGIYLNITNEGTTVA